MGIFAKFFLFIAVTTLSSTLTYAGGRLPSECDKNLTQGGHPLIKAGDIAVIVLVDGYSTGSRLPAEYRKLAAERGIPLKLFHIHSHGTPPSDFAGSWKPENFDRSWPPEGHGTPTIEQARKAVLDYTKEVNGVLIDVERGAEPGVWFGSELRVALRDTGIPDGGINRAWRNKALAQKALRDAGMPFIREFPLKKRVTWRDAQQRVDDPDYVEPMSERLSSLFKWLNAEGLFEPGTLNCDLAIKPTEGGGTRGFRRVRSWNELNDAIDEIFSEKTSSGDEVTELTVQEFLGDPNEYSVQTVMHQHPVTGLYTVRTEVFLHEKRLSRSGKAVIYWRDTLLERDSPLAQLLLQFDADARQAMGMREGANHSEYKFRIPGVYTRENLRMLEPNYRLIGAQHAVLTEMANPGWGQHVVLARRTLDPAAFFATPGTFPDSKLKPLCYNIQTSGRPGMKLSPQAEDLLRRTVPGFRQFNPYQKGDKELEPTENLPTSLAEVWVVGTPEEIARAAAIIEGYESRGELEVPR